MRRTTSTASTYCAEFEHWRGNLAAAEVNARSALELFGGSPAYTWGARSTTGLLAEALAQRGELAAALELVRAPDLPHRPHLYGEAGFLHYKGRVLLAHDPEAAVAALLECGERLAKFGESNPACYPWRSGAALALIRLGRRDRARELAGEELTLAERTGSLRSIGMALRAVGLATEGERSVELLRRAVETLARSPARLEHARALADLGAALRRARRRAEAREPLRAALDGATAAGAVPLAEHIRTELLATGARPRRDRFTGSDALTPSERRVATMAAEGMTNRDIAQALFVTVKTVGTHLGHVYRKLGIASRTELADALGSEP